MQVDAERLRADLEQLAGFGRNAVGGIDRASFSSADRSARDWLASRCDEAGLTYREDAIGNIFMRSDGPEAPPVWAGSHLDAVPNGGMFDGALGVMAAVECLRVLRSSDAVIQRPVEAVAFADEEGAFLSLLGSSAVATGLSEDDIADVVGRDGVPLPQALEDFGLDPSQVGDARIEPGEVHAFIELHIEQSPHLDRAGIPVGVATSVVGIGRGRASFTGRADHAGTTPMDDRRDALRGLSSFVLAAAGIPEAAGHPDAVVTCGKVEVQPGAYNIVADRAVSYLDFRSDDLEVIRALEEAIEREAAEAARIHGLDVSYEHGALVEPIELDRDLRRLIHDEADRLGLQSSDLPSRAGHDAQNMARITRSAVIFVPSVGGRSHSPAELTSWQDVEHGANVLLGVVSDLCGARS